MNISRSTRQLACGLLLAMLLMPQAALACRCADQGLQTYYKLADSVFFAQVTEASRTGYPRAGIGVAVQQVGKTFKGKPASLTKLFTGGDSASCGLKVEAGTHWLFFVQHDPDHPGIGHVHSCNGSRRYNPNARAGIQGFSDTSAEQVIPALNLLRDGRTPPQSRNLILERPAGGTPNQYSVIGLLEMPKLLEPARYSDRERAGFTPIPVYAAPLTGAALLEELDDRNDLPTAEFSYERPGAVVHQTRNGWYRISLREDAGQPTGWIESRHANTYWPIEKLLPERNSYLTEYWDQTLWAQPGGGLPVRAAKLPASDKGKYPARIVDSRSIADSLWWKVEIFDRSPCSSTAAPKVVYRGWVPAFDRSGRNTAWFWSRGC